MSGFEPENRVRPLTPREENAKSNVVIAYVFMLLGILTGVFWLIGAGFLFHWLYFVIWRLGLVGF